MLRSMFFATGLFVALWGVSFLFIDKIVLAKSDAPAREQGFRGFFANTPVARDNVLDPPPWAAFSLMSIGAVTMLYAVALPRGAFKTE